MTILKAYATEQDQVIEDAIKKYQSKIKEYGHSWKTMDMQKLYNRLDEELLEFDNCGEDVEATYNELLDVINVCTMLASRLKHIKGE